MSWSGNCLCLILIEIIDIAFRVAQQIKIIEKSLNPSHWSVDKGYSKDSLESEYPLRVFETEQKGSLELVLNTYEKDFKCSGARVGFYFALSMPGESVQLQLFRVLDISDDVLITLKPQVAAISNGLHNYKPQQRECFLSSERKLRFFKFYTTRNCHTECLTNLTIEKCGCARFNMPSMHSLLFAYMIQWLIHKCSFFLFIWETGDENTKICGEAKIKCYRKAQSFFFAKYDSELRYSCNCLESCEYFNYEMKIDRVRLIPDMVKQAIESQKTSPR